MVRDPQGKPLADVGLSAREAGGSMQIDYVKTDAQGRYRLRNLPLAALEIGLSKDDYGRKEVTTQLGGASGTLDVTFPPRPDGGSIAGVVRDAQGKPIAGATLKNMGGSSNEVREVKTDADGRFRMDNLYEGSTGKDVLVMASGSAPKRVGVTPGTREEPSEITIDLAPGHRIRGRVVDEKGGPLAGVMVDFEDGRNPFGDGGRVDTGADGLFSFDALPPNAKFGFSKAGYSDIQYRPLPLDGDEPFEVAMSPAGVIAGKVLDAATGEPLTRFLVQITFSPDRRPGDPLATLRSDLCTPGQTFQSPEGAFQITDLVSGLPLQVMVSVDGYERAVAKRVEAGPPGAVPAEEFRLEPIDPKTLVSYDGQLVYVTGKPVVGAQVRLVGSRERPAGHRQDFPFNWQMIRIGQAATDARVTRFHEAVTDAQGLFDFPDVPQSMEVELVYWGKGVVPGRADHLEALDRRPGESLEIATPVGGKVVGGIDRKTYPNAGHIRISDQDGATDYDDVELKPDQADYEIGDLAPGTYTITLSTRYERSTEIPNGLTSKTLESRTITVPAGGTERVDFK